MKVSTSKYGMSRIVRNVYSVGKTNALTSMITMIYNCIDETITLIKRNEQTLTVTITIDCISIHCSINM